MNTLLFENDATPADHTPNGALHSNHLENAECEREPVQFMENEYNVFEVDFRFNSSTNMWDIHLEM